MSERRCKHFQGRFAVYGPVHPVDGGDYAPLAVYAEESDARLSAAAPDLLEAVNIARRLCAEHGFIEYANLFKAAIRKAEGKLILPTSAKAFNTL